MNVSSASKYLTSIAGVALVFVVIILVNAILSTVRIRADLTEDKLYTVSDSTQSLLHEMEREVELKFYFSRNADDLPIPLKQYASRVEDLLYEYEQLSGGKISIALHNPSPDSDDEEWAQRYGLVGQAMNPLGGDPIYFGLVAVSGAREAAIPFIAPQMEPQLEYYLTRLIDDVTVVNKPVVGILSSLPVGGSQPNPFSPQPQGQDRPWSLIADLDRQYETRTIAPGADSIPEDVTLLLAIHPKALSPQTLYAMDQFILGGGRMIALVDPLSIVDQQAQQSPMMMQSPGGSSDLNPLTQAWGYTLQPQQIIADPQGATRLSLGQGRVQEVASFVTYGSDFFDRDQISMAQLDSMSLPFPGNFAGEPAEGLTVSPLITPSDEAVLVSSFMAAQPGHQILQNGQPVENPVIALKLEGLFPSAFADGPPAPTGDESANGQINEGRPHLEKAEKEAAVILIADVDFANDAYSTRAINLPFGQQMVEPINDNLIFVGNLIEQLTGSQQMIGLRSRGTFSRPFEKVEALSKQAQKKWQAEEEKLTQSLQEAQMRLNQLQAAKSQDQQLILSPEQAAEVEKVREQRFEAQKNLREVRKNLRQDIERLGYKLKAINLAAVPLLVILFGVVRSLNRKRKAKSSAEQRGAA